MEDVEQLNLGHILTGFDVDPTDVVAIRHTLSSDGLQNFSEEAVFAWTCEQVPHQRFQAPIWLVFIAEPRSRARLVRVLSNHGETNEPLTSKDESHRRFDLRPSGAFGSLVNQLVVQWANPRNWSPGGVTAGKMAIATIGDPEAVGFPGYDSLLIDYVTLQDVVSDPRYLSWQAALASVQGIYLIADGLDGKLYVGKADGGDGILGRWRAYAQDGHGGNVALRKLAGLNPALAGNFIFSILRVFGPSTPASDVDAAEEHYKKALLSRSFGHNRN